MQYIFKKGANVNLDTTSRSQSVQGKAVSKSNWKRGDLMFFTNESRKNNVGVDRIGHVALYLGDNHILHTASDYAVIEEISAKRWSYFISARRAL
jgi:Cell wall-associated hydrolases (invasion-associated proteins)